MDNIIYRATFPNGKVYIGKTKNFKMRIYHHIWNSKKSSNNIILYKAIRKYGHTNIVWDIIDTCETYEELADKEIFYIKEYKSIEHENGYNMVCGDRDDFDREVRLDDYKIEIVLKKLEANGHDPSKYVILTEELSDKILNDYVINELSIRFLVKKYKITKNRITRLLIRSGINIVQDRAVKTNTKTFDDYYIKKVIDMYNSGLSIKDISNEENITILLVSRILHDSGVRESKRFKNGKRYDGRQPKKVRELNN